ncbi:hypothetical protein GCM10018781_57130 [Kitasatospora indigofera]|uniref:Uncharacterized protein n=1 Tax=Kitasatospora indigofera TaxID=67307 RepID=A0A919L0A7_9ACTN|nr:hypothetical protein GCM10018781_57130 [Kitasatospora indigofera]
MLPAVASPAPARTRAAVAAATLVRVVREVRERCGACMLRLLTGWGVRSDPGTPKRPGEGMARRMARRMRVRPGRGRGAVRDGAPSGGTARRAGASGRWRPLAAPGPVGGGAGRWAGGSRVGRCGRVGQCER